MALQPTPVIARRKLRRGSTVTTGDLALTPIVLEELTAATTEGGCWLVAAKRPVAVIVASPAGRRLVRLRDFADEADPKRQQ